MLSITLWFRPPYTSGALSTVVTVPTMDEERLTSTAQQVWDMLQKGGFDLLCERPCVARPDAADVYDAEQRAYNKAYLDSDVKF